MSDQRAMSLGRSLAEPAALTLLAQSGAWSRNVMSSNGSLSSVGIGTQIKLWEPRADEPDLWPGMLFSSAEPRRPGYYEFRFRPLKAETSEKRNIDQYDESVRLFREALSNPTLVSLDGNDDAPRIFRRWLAQRPGRGGGRLSPNTQRKHMTAVEAVLATAEAISKRNPFGCGLISRAPHFEKPPTVVNPDIEPLSLDEISAWLAACERATTPRWCAHERHLPRLWNQSLIVFCYNSGLRIGEAIKVRRSWITERYGSKWLAMPAEACKHKRQGRLVSLNSAAFAAISAAPEYCEDVVFHWPHGMGYLDEKLGELTDAAGIRRGRHTRKLCHALRRACSTQLSSVASHYGFVRMHLGHRDVTLDHYLERGPALAESVARLPQPVWRPDRDGDQMLMF